MSLYDQDPYESNNMGEQRGYSKSTLQGKRNSEGNFELPTIKGAKPNQQYVEIGEEMVARAEQRGLQFTDS